MNSKLPKVMVILGTRPEAVKLAPVVLALKKMGFNVKVVATGQHMEMLMQVIDFFGMEACLLDCMSADLLENTACMTKALKNKLLEEKPDAVLVQGDTLSCYMGAYSAFLNKLPVMHLEAGLRSHDKFSPFPEELYRKLTDSLSDIFFAPTPKAVDNLLSEGVRKDRILLTGNTVVDAMHLALKRLDREKIKGEIENITGKKIDAYEGLVFITSHRRENFGKPLENIREAILELSKRYSSLLFLWSVHKNPEVRKVVMDGLKSLPENLSLVEPLTYPQTVYALEKAKVIITDSGGLQEEACAFKKPVLITRKVSERPEVVEVGLGRIVGTEKENIIKSFDEVYLSYDKFSNLEFENPYGDGRASERIAGFLLCPKVMDFILNYRERYREDLHECSERYSYPAFAL
ncbi:non-hydrolyzing UDP-N-acetylglucosamine 2-epimerase [Hydrogenobacter thermophilus]|uniref:non-hydrolyzing UDP-N-acetylglucosamine 2-epimerase n=1 Tax=Hydrogenobacter thermophilus TaxID=940 RepID=UPI0030F85A34